MTTRNCLCPFGSWRASQRGVRNSRSVSASGGPPVRQWRPSLVWGCPPQQRPRAAGGAAAVPTRRRRRSQRSEVRASYPAETYAKLVAVKDRYDPTNVFRLNQNIRPASGPPSRGLIGRPTRLAELSGGRARPGSPAGSARADQDGRVPLRSSGCGASLDGAPASRRRECHHRVRGWMSAYPSVLWLAPSPPRRGGACWAARPAATRPGNPGTSSVASSPIPSHAAQK